MHHYPKVNKSIVYVFFLNFRSIIWRIKSIRIFLINYLQQYIRIIRNKMKKNRYFFEGIPIFLLCIANLSGVLGDMTRYIYSRILCRCYYASKKRRSTSTTIDYMNNTAIENIVNKNVKESDSNHPYLYDDNQADVETNPNNEIIKKNLDTVVIQNELTVRLEDDDERVQVPLTVSMLIMTAYLALGALTFNYFEQWGLVTSTYFSFVTVATIGTIFQMSTKISYFANTQIFLKALEITFPVHHLLIN
jgi:hypothetical protein